MQFDHGTATSISLNSLSTFAIRDPENKIAPDSQRFPAGTLPINGWLSQWGTLMTGMTALLDIDCRPSHCANHTLCVSRAEQTFPEELQQF